MKPEPHEIYSYTNGFGFTSTIKILRVSKLGIIYNKLLDDGEWGNIELLMKQNIFSLYKKIN
jgi:hypothetical protein